MAMAISSLADLNLLHWLVSGAVPFLLLVLGLVDRLVLSKADKTLTGLLAELGSFIRQLSGRGMDNWPPFLQAAGERCPQTVLTACEQMEEDSKQHFQGRWLPDVKTALPLSLWLTPAQRSALSYKPAAHILTSGILAAVISWLIQQPLPVADPGFSLLLILLPVLTALAVSISLLAATHHSIRQHKESLDRFYTDFSRRLPVFNDQTGIASLVNAYLEYDNQMQHQLQEFSSVASRLAESDMADGIRRSVEQVLTESVAPSLQQSTHALSELAGELTRRQESGMQELAGQFATALSSQLAAHMRPVNREIAQMGSLMTDVKNYIEVAMRAMDTVQKQSTSIQEDVGQSLQQMAGAHDSMHTDFSTVRDQLTELSGTTTRLAEIFQNSEKTMDQSLERLTAKMNDGIGGLSVITDRAVQEARFIRETADQHLLEAQAHQQDLQEQSTRFSSQLADALDHMLQETRQETAAIASHSEAIGQQLGKLNRVLQETMTGFTQESSTYVQQTLKHFDENLAEITERLTQTAGEIQDAVDALPAAIQRSAQFGS
ncbi:MAG: hypothetical protein GX173_02335 [Ruminococcaceae bacterium]|nr:hypothetical protein [Oscillospiraceae bacterium]